MTRVAAFDCGTNSLRLLIADLDPVTGEAVELVRAMRVVRLGEGVDESGKISDSAMRRVFAATEGTPNPCAATGLTSSASAPPRRPAMLPMLPTSWPGSRPAWA
ncbi:MAG: hypothetical protein R2709_05690 [Marmoricola sp.]